MKPEKRGRNGIGGSYCNDYRRQIRYGTACRGEAAEKKMVKLFGSLDILLNCL